MGLVKFARACIVSALCLYVNSHIPLCVVDVSDLMVSVVFLP